MPFLLFGRRLYLEWDSSGVCIRTHSRGGGAPNAFFYLYFFISLIADGPHSILPVVTKDLPTSPRFTPYIFFLITMQVQHSYSSSTNGWILLTQVFTLSAKEEKTWK